MIREKTISLIELLSERIRVMEAALDNADIEAKYFTNSDPVWRDTDPCWDWINNDYRVKPKKPRTLTAYPDTALPSYEAIEVTDEVHAALKAAGIEI